MNNNGNTPTESTPNIEIVDCGISGWGIEKNGVIRSSLFRNKAECEAFLASNPTWKDEA